MIWLDAVHTFYSIDLAFGIVSAFVAFFIAGYALRSHLLTKDRTSLFFSSTFFLMAFGLLSRVLFDYMVKFELTYNPRLLALQGMSPLQAALLTISIFLMTSGYAFLIALFFKITSRRIIALLIILIALLILTTSNAYLTAHLIPAVMLFFVLLHTTENFLRRKTRNTFLVCASFIILFASEMLFLLLLQSVSFYFIGSTLRVFAYLLLLANILLVLKR